MNFLRSMLNYAKDAWSLIQGAPGDAVSAYRALWKFTGSLHVLFSNLFGNVGRLLHWRHIGFSQTLLNALGDLLNALERVKNWIWKHQVHPLKVRTARDLNRVQKRLLHDLWLLRQYDIRLFFAALGYAWRLFAKERTARIKHDKAGLAYTQKLVKAALATVDKDAANGYNSGLKARKNLVATIANDLADRLPAVKTLVKDLIAALLDFLEIDNPVLRVALGFALNKLVSHEGVDKLTGDMLTRLIGELTGERRVTTLRQVTADASARLTGLEEQWAEFGANGGQQLENVGREIRTLESLPVELSIIAFFAMAVADPQRWASDVSDTAGAAVNKTADAIASLIRKA